MRRAKRADAGLGSFHLVRDVLDREVVDADGVPCGAVDDVELALGQDGGLAIVALRMGPGAWAKRMPWPLSRALARGRMHRVKWAHVRKLGERIELDVRAGVLGLDAAERRWRRWIEKIPLA